MIIDSKSNRNLKIKKSAGKDCLMLVDYLAHVKSTRVYLDINSSVIIDYSDDI